MFLCPKTPVFCLFWGSKGGYLGGQNPLFPGVFGPKKTAVVPGFHQVQRPEDAPTKVGRQGLTRTTAGSTALGEKREVKHPESTVVS